MTVRTWLTISAVCVVALFAAVILKLAAPVRAPTMDARVGEIRLDRDFVRSCWPNGSKTRCDNASGFPAAVNVPRRGTLRVIVAYPLQPTAKQGYIEVRRGSTIVFHKPWKENTPYDLAPGRYELIAYAKYASNAHIENDFSFRVG